MIFPSWAVAIASLSVVFLFFCLVKYITSSAHETKSERCSLWEWKKKAHDGDVQAQYQVAFLYEMGIDAPQSNRKALYWFCRAYLSGHDAAAKKIAKYYTYDLEVRGQDIDRAVWWMTPGNDSEKMMEAQDICKRIEVDEGV